MAITDISMTSADAWLKQVYLDKGKLYRLDLWSTPFIDMITKDPTARGKTWNVPAIQNSVVGGSQDDATAYATATAGNDVDFFGAWKGRTAVAQITNKVLKMASDDKGAFGNLLEQKMTGLKNQFKQVLDFQIPRDEGGSIGQLASTVTVSTNSGSFTSATAGAAQFLNVGRTLVLGPNKDGTSLRGGTDLVVASVDAIASSFTTTAAINGQSSAAAGDFVFEKAAVTTQTQAMAGFESWNPTTLAEANASFKGVTRVVDTTKLSGIRVDGSGKSIQQSLLQAVSDVSQYGASPSHIFLHPKKFAQLVQEMGSNSFMTVQAGSSFTKKGAKAEMIVGFTGLNIAVGGQPIMVYQAAACQSNIGWVKELSAYELHSDAPLPTPLDEGGRMLRLSTASTWQMVLAGYYELICRAPGHQCNVTFA